ncbi:MAG: hypothetical protein P9M03_02785 [Candidatus Theseobacter exili]|nr:hypothetical protein [Candidatus Theseobacter exili]
MEKQKDIRYSITSIENGEYKNVFYYRVLKGDIETDGFVLFPMNTGAIKVYNAEQAFILSNRALEVENCDTKELITIDGIQYLKSFLDGYKQGELYFSNEFKGSPTVIYGEHSESYIGTILNHFYDTEHETGRKGWQFIRFEYPVILTHKTIRKYGYYSGIVNKVQELIKLHPEPFKKVPIVSQPQPIKNKDLEEKENTLRNEIKSAFSFMQRNDIRKHKLILNNTDFQNLINWVYYYFDNEFSLPEIEQPIQTINTAKGNVIYTFINLFKRLHPSGTKPQSLYLLIKACFFEYRKDNVLNYSKQKEPQFYNDIISKSK